MTDKQIIIDPCDKCDVEPPALKFKCPTCEYNKENKQIIIDGVDVSGCEFVFTSKDKQTLCWCNKLNIKCKDNPNCYYKNWQRAEQKLRKIEKVCDKFIPDHFKILLIIEGGIVEE